MQEKPYTRTYEQLRILSGVNLRRHLNAARNRRCECDSYHGFTCGKHERLRMLEEILTIRNSPDWKPRRGKRRARPAITRFEANYIPEPNSGCWLWTSSLSKNGYGKFSEGRRQISAHRFSYETFVGPIEGDKYILHRCDVRSCVNPDHLFVGTALDNTRDMISKGRASWHR